MTKNISHSENVIILPDNENTPDPTIALTKLNVDPGSPCFPSSAETASSDADCARDEKLCFLENAFRNGLD